MKKCVKVGSGHVLVVSGAHVRVLTLINSRHFKNKLCMNIKDVHFDIRKKIMFM